MIQRQLTNGELELLDQLWKLGEACPEDVQNSLRESGKKVTGGTDLASYAYWYNKGSSPTKQQLLTRSGSREISLRQVSSNDPWCKGPSTMRVWRLPHPERNRTHLKRSDPPNKQPQAASWHVATGAIRW